MAGGCRKVFSFVLVLALDLALALVLVPDRVLDRDRVLVLAPVFFVVFVFQLGGQT